MTDVIVLGGLASLGGLSATISPDVPGAADTDVSETSVAIGPKIDALLSPGSSVRPLIGARVALVHSSQDLDGSSLSLTGVQLAARLGIRAFLGPMLSLDPLLDVGWMTASGESDLSGTTVDTSASGFGVGVLLGLSGWL